MYYRTIVANLDSKNVMKKSDFTTPEQWDEYAATCRKLQNCLVAWRNDASAEARDKFFATLKDFYGTIAFIDGAPRYVPQSAEVEIARYGFISANVKTRRKHNAASLAYEDTVVLPAMRNERKAALELSLDPLGYIEVTTPEGVERVSKEDYHEFLKGELALARKECEKLMDVYKQIEPMSEQAFRKGFETALAEAIAGKKMMTVEERNAAQKKAKEEARAKRALVEAEVRVAQSKQA